jgi:hypothetical protein
MSKPPHSDTVTNRWGWQFMQGDGMSVAAMNSVGAKRVPSGPSAPPVAVAPPPSMFGNLMATIGQGFSFGTGSEVAHKAVDTVVSSPSVIKLDTATTDELIRDIGLSCGYFKTVYDDCVYNDKRECEKINGQYRECLDILKKYDNIILT